VVEEVAVGPAYASDVRLGLRALGQGGAGGKLLADRGFDSGAIWALLEGKGMEAHIPLKGGGETRDRRRLAARKPFDPSIYRLRGVVEGVFGALKTRLAGGYLQEVLSQMAQKRAYLEAAAYNLRALLRLLLRLLLSPPPPYLLPSDGPFARQAQSVVGQEIVTTLHGPVGADGVQEEGREQGESLRQIIA